MTEKRKGGFRGMCALMCGRDATTGVCGYRLCLECVGRIRAIATDAGVPIDEEMLGGALRSVRQRQLTKAEKRLAELQERREIAAARRSA